MSDRTPYGALRAHDAAFDGRFVYAVITTGIYCRPGCASRRPQARNVRFFADGAAARRAGFRPCKRCRPDEQGGAPSEWIERARRVLETADDVPTLEGLAAAVGVSRAHLQRGFTKAIGVSPRRYAAALRERRLRSALSEGANVTDAAYASGYGSSAALYAAAPGMTPGALRSGAAGETIFYAVVPSALGTVLVATTERGICRVSLGDDAGALERELRSAFPRATLERAEHRLRSATSALVRYLAAEGPWPRLPLDVRATAFQARVWGALTRIAPGTTTSYGELARALGDPRAARAVARACAGNPLALLIPCHRVVARDGTRRGYRWGLARKEGLLALERGA